MCFSSAVRKFSIKSSSIESYFSAGTCSYTRAITASITEDTVSCRVSVFVPVQEDRRTQTKKETYFMRQRCEDKKRAGRLKAIDPYWIPLTQTSIYDVSNLEK